MPVERLEDINLDDLTAEQMVRLLDNWAAFLSDTNAPDSLVHALDLLSANIEADRISQPEAVALMREFLARVGSLRGAR